MELSIIIPARNEAKRIGSTFDLYSQYFPAKSEAFFYDGLTDGSDYTVKCWINVTTKARLK